MRRSRYRRDFSSSRRLGYGRGAPLKGPIAMIFSIGMFLFFASFVLNIVLMITFNNYFESFGLIFFFIPFGIMAILVPTMIIASIVQAFKVMKNPQAFANEQMDQGFGQTVNVSSLAQQAGYQVNQLPSNDPSTAQFLLESDQRKILVKVLPPSQVYRNGIVQDLSKGLGQYLAQEAWVIQTPPTFTDNDLNFARFYNVKLLSQDELSKLLSAQSRPPRS
jgi:hypothetical protein